MEIEKLIQEDLSKYPQTATDVTRAAPIMDAKASAKPAVKEIATGEYNTQTGVQLLHPLNLMTMMAEENPWVDLAIKTIGSACSSTTPLFRFDVKTSKSYKKKRQAEIDKLADLLEFPNLHQSGYELFRTTYENLVLYGNAYWQIIKTKGGDIHSIYTLPPETMRAVPYFDENEILHFGYVQLDAVQGPKVFLESEIIHFKTTNNRSFTYGKPMFLSQLVQIATSISAKKALASWFEQGFVGGAVFKQDADPDVADRNRAFIKEFFTKPENFGKTMILEGGMELVKDGNKFADFDFSKLSATDRDNILMAAGVPLSQAGVRSDSGNANAEIVAAEESAFIRNTFGMIHSYVFEKLNSKLIRQILGWTDVKISAGAPMKFSMKDSIETVRALSDLGIGINEARELLSIAPVPSEEAGETFVITTNNGVIKASDTLGVDLGTGEVVQTIFEKSQEMQKELAEMGAKASASKEKGATKAGSKKGASGLGGNLKKMAEG